jgi:hypothetical protein
MELNRAVVRCNWKDVLNFILQLLMTQFNAYENFFSVGWRV